MFKCDECGTTLILDYRHSAAFYNSNVTTVLDEESEIDFNLLPKEVVYVCRRCGKTKIIDLETVVYTVKKKITDAVLNIRYDTVYKNFGDSVVNEENGIAFCGMCRGVIDDAGHCYNDVIKECPVRKALNDKKYFTERSKYRA
jgi:predicted RNA-binding Zn-ribbon protein involved in translation (DUF1610 family)